MFSESSIKNTPSLVLDDGWKSFSLNAEINKKIITMHQDATRISLQSELRSNWILRLLVILTTAEKRRRSENQTLHKKWIVLTSWKMNVKKKKQHHEKLQFVSIIKVMESNLWYMWVELYCSVYGLHGIHLCSAKTSSRSRLRRKSAARTNTQTHAEILLLPANPIKCITR